MDPTSPGASVWSAAWTSTPRSSSPGARLAARRRARCTAVTSSGRSTSTTPGT
ncbi:hypothetical protein ONE63_007238 [Megalurothrips usitatus]|uniref:Uncharacterized protein n=1 Tax=Megalurothrips usitatus TaxID=439358 RepID=A0AAV7XVM2_9NEOP|nr:hypothetical protein ONE63_007238 [Megalurothrips usitatus]